MNITQHIYIYYLNVLILLISHCTPSFAVTRNNTRTRLRRYVIGMLLFVCSMRRDNREADIVRINDICPNACRYQRTCAVNQTCQVCAGVVRVTSTHHEFTIRNIYIYIYCTLDNYFNYIFAGSLG